MPSNHLEGPPLGSPRSSHNEAIQDSNASNRPAQGCFPSQTLRGPGQTGGFLPPPPCDPPTAPHKRKRETSPEYPAVGGYGPILHGLDNEPNPLTPDRDPSPKIKRTKRKTSAYDIWAFIRPVETDEDIQIDRFPNDYDEHLETRPDTPFIGCKFCTQFGNIHGVQVWKVFNNGQQTSPTSTVRHHFEREHLHAWQSECRRLNVPQKTQKKPTGQVPGPSFHEVTREGIVTQIQKFIVGSNRSADLVESPSFRKLLLYVGQGRFTDDDIPGREYLSERIIEAQKAEREQPRRDSRRKHL